MLWALGPLLSAQPPARAQNTQKAGKLGDQSEVEEIYIARSVRESRVTPKEFCAEAKTGFKSTIEDQYTFRATATRTSDGRIIDTNAKTIASGRACLGPTEDNPAIANFYLELPSPPAGRAYLRYRSLKHAWKRNAVRNLAETMTFGKIQEPWIKWRRSVGQSIRSTEAFWNPPSCWPMVEQRVGE
jgi:hypothetical protein